MSTTSGLPSTARQPGQPLRLGAVALAAASALAAALPATALAQAAGDTAERITIVGSRRQAPAVSSTDTTVPVDV
ncbi:MAG TPA: hypothetical protein PK306_07415 [Aquabacterium sp.]|nr:hypothetical protein [Aquabacterium sp.]HQC95520.1 hypothetical protein [Aquabacterium sp.]